jgi:hypothetical protein
MYGLWTLHLTKFHFHSCFLENYVERENIYIYIYNVHMHVEGIAPPTTIESYG